MLVTISLRNYNMLCFYVNGVETWTLKKGNMSRTVQAFKMWLYKKISVYVV